MKKELLLEKVREAKAELIEAETHLERVLAAILVAPRAEKVRISDVAEAAFDKLRAARRKLAEVETIVAADDDDDVRPAH